MLRHLHTVSLLALLMLIGPRAESANIFVTPAGSGGGANWGDATSLTNALASASNNDDIWLAQGTYTNADGMSTNFDVTGFFTTNAFHISANDLTLYGGFTNGMATLGERDWDAYPAIIDGGAVSDSSRRRVLMVTANTTLDGLIITNGIGWSGPGIYANGSYDVTIRNCRIVECHLVNNNGSGPHGHAVYFNGGTVSISNTVFAGNGAPYNSDRYNRHGQAIYAYNENVTITDCVFSNNAADFPYSQRGGKGGAIYIAGASSSLTVEDTDFVDNRSPTTSNNGGGAASIEGGTAGFRRCLFRRNGAGTAGASAAQPEEGGALWIGSSGNLITIDHCIFDRCASGAGDSTTADGGAVAVINGNVTVTNCTFVGNTSKDEGGAVYLEGGTFTMVHSILYTNDAPTRGADISVLGGTATISYSRLDGTGQADAYDVGGLTLSMIMTNDPLFAAAGDAHLRSPSGRYDPGSGTFVTTDSFPHSPCINAGDVSTPVGSEPATHGSRINLGRYGGTAEASKSTGLAPAVENRSATTDFNLAVVRGELVNFDAIAFVTVYYGTNPIITNTDSAVSLYPPEQTGTVFQTTLIGLDFNTTYYYRWFATNATSLDWAGSVSNFTTGTAPPGGPSGVIHVKKDATGGETGTDWFNAYKSVADAVGAVSAGTNEIWIAAATYGGTIVNIGTDTSIYGGFDGTETNRAQRDVAANEVRIDGDNDRRCVVISGGTVHLDGLTITNGNGFSAGSTGGGIHASGTYVLTMNNCRVTGNSHGPQPTASGMGLYAVGGSVMLTNTTFSGNKFHSHGNHGIGLWASGTTLTIVDCTFSEPIPFSAGRASDGGGIHVSGGTLDVRRSHFINNRIGDAGDTSDTLGGGGAWLGGGVVAGFYHCTFVSNTVFASGSSSYGGAISLQGSTSTAVVENCTIVGSKVGKHGGAVWVKAGHFEAKNCILFSNLATDIGHDIATGGGVADVSYCSLSGEPDDPDTLHESSGTLTKGSGLFHADPLFAGLPDVHLKSRHGRYDPAIAGFTNDAVLSPCIDAAQPGGSTTFTNEPLPNGGRGNLGAYGNSTQASKNLVNAPIVENRAPTVTNNLVTLRGELVTVDTTADVTIFYGLSDGGEDTGGWEASVPLAQPQQTGTVFEVKIGSLFFDTNYAFRCFATNSVGFDWAAVSNFTTGGEPPGGPDTVIHVLAGAPGSQSGETWFDACHTLAAGVAQVNGSTNEIWVANRTENMNTTVTISTNVSIYGGFLGTETNCADRALTNVTLFDGLFTRRILHITAGTVLVDGLTITNGLEGGAGSGLRAAGIFDLTLANCMVTRNGRTAGDDGAGAYFSGGIVTISNCTFRENGFGHSIQGGGLFASGADVTILDSVFTNNGAPGYDGRGSDGGAIYVSGGSLDVTGSSFIENNIGSTDNHRGGAIDVAGAANADIGNCVFRGNRGYYNSSDGSGSDGAALGVVVSAGYTVDVVNCTFAYNTDANRGGAIYVGSGALELKNCILWSNEVSDVAGADALGAEIFAQDATTLSITYTDITGTNSNDVVVVGTNGVFSLGAGNLMTDPLFVSTTDLHLQSRKGHYTPLGFIPDSQTSPCIDAGDPLSPKGLEPDPRGRHINLGAYGNTAQASKTPVTGTVFMFE